MLLRTKWQLAAALFGKGEQRCVSVLRQSDSEVIEGWLDSVQPEDGSGRCFNLLIQTRPSTGKVWVFWRSED